ncbi:TetR/AcrR family transcriptional regulator [Yinghuangia seranimata]|uniref:TetR/AcrR family transcriptional regulator n=1 Tax=Yinghuangia seranimata TaxID=408067 RepID=UPI00248BE3E0|nr:TetR/AcrR family transcriptional regulator [Yinghuangia seranimata]MDI2127039.1 TetR/AcrR family transcriptional regulator [Yinghuangia seranimata]
MTQVADQGRDRISRRQVDKFEERRKQLADSALRTLAELGYARTSLRDIAQNSEFSHGVLHYYFRDKVDLITQCVRQYKTECVKRYDHIVADADTADGLAHGFADAMAATLRDDAAMHRLWYDLRNQSLFEESFREDVLQIDDSLERMIARIVDQYAELAGRPTAFPPAVTYALYDGLFQQALLRHIAGDPEASADLAAHVLRTLPATLAEA